MTLKQFFQLAGGILVGLIFYSLPLLAVIRWPLAIISVILGIGLAFFPLEERPLEKWIVAFFKSIYSPTIFYWQKTTTPPKLFQDEDSATQITATPEQEEALKKYLATQVATESPLETAERGFLSKMSGMLGSLQTTVSTATQVNQSTNQPINPVAPVEKKELTVPQTETIKVVPQEMPKLVVQEKPKEVVNENIVTTNTVAPIIAGNEMISTREAIFSVDAAPPSPPTLPNTVVGQVVNQDRKIIEGAIMEIRDDAGRPVRALRSNKAGHFMIVTALDSGRYNIVTEKDGYEFMPIYFHAEGKLIPPILIKGVKTQNTTNA